MNINTIFIKIYKNIFYKNYIIINLLKLKIVELNHRYLQIEKDLLFFNNLNDFMFYFHRIVFI